MTKDENPTHVDVLNAASPSLCAQALTIAKAIQHDAVQGNSRASQPVGAQGGAQSDDASRWGTNPGRRGRPERVRDYRVWRPCTLFAGSLKHTPIRITGRFGGAVPRGAAFDRTFGDTAFHFRDRLLALLVNAADQVWVQVENGSTVQYAIRWVQADWGVAVVRAFHVEPPEPVDESAATAQRQP